MFSTLVVPFINSLKRDLLTKVFSVNPKIIYGLQLEKPKRYNIEIHKNLSEQQAYCHFFVRTSLQKLFPLIVGFFEWILIASQSSRRWMKQCETAMPQYPKPHQGHNTLHEKLNEQKKTANFQSLTLTYCFALNLIAILIRTLYTEARKTEGPREQSCYIGRSARAEWPTFLPSQLKNILTSYSRVRNRRRAGNKHRVWKIWQKE